MCVGGWGERVKKINKKKQRKNIKKRLRTFKKQQKNTQRKTNQENLPSMNGKLALRNVMYTALHM